jgi:hypothetical protein
MRAEAAAVALIASVLVASGCGSGARETAHTTPTSPTTISGVGVTTGGPPPKLGTQESPYKPSVARACLIRRGAHHVKVFWKPTGLNYPLLSWNGGMDHAIDMYFFASPAQALADLRKVRHSYETLGYNAGWIQGHLMRRENIVITASYTKVPALLAGQRATLVACFRQT